MVHKLVPQHLWLSRDERETGAWVGEFMVMEVFWEWQIYFWVGTGMFQSDFTFHPV